MHRQIADLESSKPLLFSKGFFYAWGVRAPKIADPTRTRVLPAWIAASKSALIPKDKVSNAKPWA
jgi:hypothetical protein